MSLSTETARSLLWQHYGLDASLTALDGDEDNNFRAESKDGKEYTFKVMHHGCTEEAVALPCAVLQHLGPLSLNIPRVIPSLAGKSFESVAMGAERRFIWLLSWCDGTLLVDYSPHNKSIYRSFGETLARLDKGLQGLSHPAMHVHSRWQLSSAMDSAEKVTHIEGETQGIARDIFARFDTTVRARLPGLPHSIIHNDANDYNVLVNQGGDEAIVDGLFDFGDACWQPVICEVAIALAYLVHRKEDPLHVCASFLAAYSEVSPLTGPELNVLFDLICTRLAVTVAISSHRQKREPENKYIVYSQLPSKNAMMALHKIGPDRAEKAFRLACGLAPVELGKGIEKLS